MAEMVVHSSNGDFEINEIGLPLNLHEIQEAMEVTILKFDLDEHKETYGELDTGFDILDLGYWYAASDGTLEYEPPDEDFRAEFPDRRRKCKSASSSA